jgi:hypothetical protein
MTGGSQKKWAAMGGREKITILTLQHIVLYNTYTLYTLYNIERVRYISIVRYDTYDMVLSWSFE